METKSIAVDQASVPWRSLALDRGGTAHIQMYLAGSDGGPEAIRARMNNGYEVEPHFHLAALGFATLTAVGVSSRIVPMFLACERAPVWPLRWIGPVAGAGLLLFAGGQIGHVRPATLAGAALLALAMAGYLGLVTVYFRTRTRPIDPALGHIAAAFVGLAAAVVAG